VEAKKEIPNVSVLFGSCDKLGGEEDNNNVECDVWNVQGFSFQIVRQFLCREERILHESPRARVRLSALYIFESKRHIQTLSVVEINMLVTLCLLKCQNAGISIPDVIFFHFSGFLLLQKVTSVGFFTQ